MPTTANLLLPYPASTDPVDVPADMQRLADRVDTSVGVVSATPPASPFDGQRWSLVADATNGIVWTFRYRAASASAYKWEFVGGVPLFATVSTTEPVTTGGWSNPATVGPDLVVPRAGDYRATFNCYVGGGGAIATVQMGISNASVSGTPIFGAVSLSDCSAAGYVQLGTHCLLAALGASNTLRALYNTSVSGASFGLRNLSVFPVRVS